MAIQLVRQSVYILHTRGREDSLYMAELAKDHLKLGTYYRALGQVSDGMKELDSCIALSRRQGSVGRVYLFALWTRTKYLFDIGDFARCSDYAIEGEEDAKKAGDPDHYYNNFLHFRINAQLEMNHYQEGKQLLEHKVEEAKTGAPEYVWRLYAQMARVAIAAKNYTMALRYYDQAFRFALASNDHIGCLEMLVNKGYYVYYKGKGDARQALVYYQSALAFANRGEALSTAEALENLNLLTNIGDAYVQFGEYDSAFHYFQLAYDQLRPGIDETGLSNTSLEAVVNYDRVWFLTALMIDKGDAWLREYRKSGSPHSVREAIRIYKAVDKVLDRLKSEQAEITSRLFWRSDSRRLYEHAIEAAYLDHDTEDGFYFFEKSRSVLLSDEIRQQRFITRDDLLKQAQWRKKILSLKKEAEEEGLSAARRAEITGEVFQYARGLDSLEKGIKMPAGVAAISLQDVRKQLLTGHRALVELFDGDSNVYVLLVTSVSSSLTSVNKADFDSLARSYLFYVSHPVATNRDMKGWLATAFRLYRMLFPRDTIPAGRIIVSPDGRYFPFEALVTRDDGQGAPAYFLLDHAVSYTYSARYLLNGAGEQDDPGSGDFMGIAPVSYAARLDLPALSGSDASLHRIGVGFGSGEELLAGQASRANFMRQFSKYRIIQLYTHAADSSEVNGEPVIWFADSALYLPDLIPEERPVTRLIVLSACETGNGKNYQGEGVFSFNREFAALGIPASVINLWAVENQSTYRLTELFYTYLSAGLPTDLALQKAKIEFFRTAGKEQQLPYYWAATVLTGMDGAPGSGRSFPWKRIAGLILLLMAALYLLQRFTQRPAQRSKALRTPPSPADRSASPADSHRQH